MEMSVCTIPQCVWLGELKFSYYISLVDLWMVPSGCAQARLGSRGVLKHRVVQYIRSGDMTKNLRVTIALASVTLIWFLNKMLPRRDHYTGVNRSAQFNHR
jgi:hypothetical protein